MMIQDLLYLLHPYLSRPAGLLERPYYPRVAVRPHNVGIVVSPNLCYRFPAGGQGVEAGKRRLMDRLRSGVPDEGVIRAMESVPREAFVPEESRLVAYEDIPVPIGEGQTISQPYIVAMMVRALEVRKTDKVLELGTGSGYQAAVLAQLAARVVTVERIKALADSAGARLAELGFDSVEVVQSEGQIGWKREAPYEAIVVAAGAPKLPHDLMHQLAVGGRLVVPVGSMESQQLMKVSRTETSYTVETLGACRFVPLIGEGAWPENRDEDRTT